MLRCCVSFGMCLKHLNLIGSSLGWHRLQKWAGFILIRILALRNLCAYVYRFYIFLFIVIFSDVFSNNLLWLPCAHHIQSWIEIVHTHTHIRATWIGSTCEQNKNWPNGENDEIYLISVSLITCPFSIHNNNWLTVTEYLSFFLCFIFFAYLWCWINQQFCWAMAKFSLKILLNCVSLRSITFRKWFAEIVECPKNKHSPFQLGRHEWARIF